MDIDALRNRISTALVEWDISSEDRHEVVFHLTDWMDNYESLKKVFESSDELSDEEIAKLLP